MKKHIYLLLTTTLVLIAVMFTGTAVRATQIQEISGVVTDVSCYLENDGAIDITVTGGIAPYNYYWSDGSSQEDRVNILAGIYTVTVHDADGHYASNSFQVNQPSPIYLEVTVLPPTCYGANNGGIDLTVFGGTAPYTFLWSNGSTDEDPQNLVSGIYQFEITDVNGCNLIGDIEVPGPEFSFDLTLNPTDVLCFGSNTGSISLNMSGGTAPYSFLWSDGVTEQNRTDLYAGFYYVTVTDATNSCTAGSVIINQPDPLDLFSLQENVTCAGEQTGMLDITVTGGTPGYNYFWTNGLNTEDLINIGIGYYSVIVVDANGCQITGGPFTITAPPSLNVSYDQTEVSCYGGNDGTISVSVTGGIPPYTYSWSNGDTTENIADLTAGTYNLTITDSLGCTSNQFFLLTEPEAIVSNGMVDQVSCYGEHDGMILLYTTGGNPPYTYLWSNGATVPNLYYVGQGTYTVTITDSDNCSAVESFVVTQPQFMWAGGVVHHIHCPGGSDGEILVSVFGGTPPYSFLWNDGFTGPIRLNMAAGHYTITATDVQGCYTSTYFDVIEPEPFIYHPVINNVSCFGGNDGSIDINLTGGTAGYSYAWNTGATTPGISGLTIGAYSVTITDSRSCTSDTTINITQPELLTLGGTTAPSRCPGQNLGFIYPEVQGGTTPYSYLWNDGSTAATRDSVFAGTYTLTVTDAEGCDETMSYTVTEPPAFGFNEAIVHISCNGLSDGSINTNFEGGTPPYTFLWSTGSTDTFLLDIPSGFYTLTVSDHAGCDISNTFEVTQPDVLDALLDVTDVSCFDGTDGAINLVPSGGTLPYTFLWNTGATTEDLDGLEAGNYQVTITDDHGCFFKTEATISEPSQLVSGGDQTDNICYSAAEGTITLTVSGGVPAYSFDWSDGNDNQDRTGLLAGDYSVTVTDQNGCTNLVDFTITEPTAVVVTPSISHVNCFGENNGSITTLTAGGTPEYEYLWNNGEITSDISNLIAGTYELTVTDGNLCQTVFSFDVNEPDLLQANGTVTNITCFNDNDGIISLDPLGGTSPYSFLWNTGETDAEITDLEPGVYSVTVTDDHSCTDVVSYEVTQPGLLTIDATVVPISCYSAHNGSISLIISGGTPDYSFEWSTGSGQQDLSGLEPGTYSVTVTDSHNCTATATYDILEPSEIISLVATPQNVSCNGENDGIINLYVSGGTPDYSYAWSHGSTDQNPSGLAAGMYTVTVTDNALLCSTLDVEITQPDILTGEGVITDALCAGSADGTITLTVTGGTELYSYTWSNGATSKDVDGLTAGPYSVTITDAHNCTNVLSFSVGQPEELSAVEDITHISCNAIADGKIELTTTGGTPGYTWNWNTGDTDEDLDGLLPGTYSVTITDTHNCSFTANYEVTQPDVLYLSLDELNPVLCHGGNNGSIYLTTNGGTAPYTYLWNDGNTDEDRTELIAGTYFVTVTDAHECIDVKEFLMTETNVLSINGEILNIKCNGALTGQINVTTTGGSEPYTYLWNDGMTGETRQQLAAGIYQVTATDNVGCTETATFEVTQPQLITITEVITAVSCYHDHDGSITTEVTGGIEPYNYYWSDGSSEPNLEMILAGTYTLTVSDLAECQIVETYEVTEPLPVTGNVSPSDQVLICSGNEIVPITFVADYYPESSVSIEWTRDHVADVTGISASGTGPVTGSLVNTTFADVTVTITMTVTVNGCPAGVHTAYVHIAPALDIVFTHGPIECYGDQVLVNVQAIGGIPPYTGQQSLYLGAGTYYFTVHDYWGCSVTRFLTLTSPPDLNIGGMINPAFCSNQPNGAIMTSVTGGVGPYTYLWSDGSTNVNRVNVVSGMYTVTVTDANECAKTHTYNLGSYFVAPQAFLNASPVGCYGQPNPLYINLTGTPPWNIVYTDGTNSYPVTGINTMNYVVYHTINQPTTFQLVSVTDIHCSGNINSMPVTITPVTPPTASMVVPQPICKGETSNITVNFTGTAPWDFTWNDGSNHTVTNIMSSPYTITSSPTVNKQYSIVSMNDAFCNASSVGNPVTQVVYPLPTAVLSVSPSSSTICSGVAVPLNVHFTGMAPWEITYTDGTNQYTVSNIYNGYYTLIVNPTVTCAYSLVSVNDLRCEGTVSGVANILVHPRPTANWGGSDSACNGSNVVLNINLTGTAPWQLIWNDGANHPVQSVLYNPYTVSSQIINDKTFVVTYLQDAFCQAMTQQQLGAPKIVTSHDLPTATLTGPSSTCYGVGGDLEIQLTGSAPWTVVWYEGLQSHTINNIISSPYLIHIDPNNTTSYFISAVSDALCLGTVQGTPLTVTVNVSPVFQLIGLADTNQVCSAQDFTFQVDILDGVPPFHLNYLDFNNDTVTIENITDMMDLHITPPNISGKYNYQILSIGSGNGCEIYLYQNFVIHVIPAPVIDAGPDMTITLGNSAVLNGSINGGIPPYTILWQPADYLDDPTSLNPTCTPLEDILYTLYVSDSIGCQISDQVFITIDMSRNIFGYVTYDNTASTPMTNVRIEVRTAQNVAVDTAYTDTQGHYTFTDLPTGSFILKGFTDKPFGGVNSTDALLILKHFVQMQLLTGHKLPASDVDGTNYINAIDALYVSKRFTGQLSSFITGDWYFSPQSFTIPTNVAQFDIKSLVYGDANGSYNPPAKLNPGVTLTGFSEINADAHGDAVIPVSVDRPLELGAISLVLGYPEESFTVTGVSLANGMPLTYTAEDGNLRISWYDVNPLRMGAFDPMILINVHLLGTLPEDLLFSLRQESELADPAAEVITEAGLLIPKLVKNTPSSAELYVNYPNPFNSQTQISYFLPQEGQVRLSVMDALGKEMSVVLRETQSAGTHTLVFDASDLPSGVYMYKLQYTHGQQEVQLIRKMTVIK